ncbi:MAG: integrase arm-type DNA-binding domain-containing protein [Betaproteobacteria bacterium]|nr:integrase arm-type DNA-binding domain-containing protein [Betaproteobacteria bacterium]
MANAHRLTRLQAERFKPPADKKQERYADGGGLYLNVHTGGSRSWVFRYMRHGIARWMGLGPYPDVSLAEARERAAEQRKLIRAGIDPLGEKKIVTAKAKAESAKAVTFDWCAEQYITAHAPSWKNKDTTTRQWRNGLKNYVAPVIGTMDVALIETGHIIKILEPIWHTKGATANIQLNHIGSILDWATVHKHRTGENPARWKGHVEMLLPARGKAATKHHPALPYGQMAEFMGELRAREGITARAIEFAILTAARSNEIRGMTWDEIDEEAGVWIIPAARMKAANDHRAPLSADALRVLADMKEAKTDNLVFPGARCKPMASSTLVNILKQTNDERIERSLPAWRDAKTGETITMHGFRSTFRDWAADLTDYPNEMAEMALAHTVDSAVEASYRRGDMLQKRRAMMQDWADYCAGRCTA